MMLGLCPFANRTLFLKCMEDRWKSQSCLELFFWAYSFLFLWLNMTAIVQYLCTVNKSAENVLQSGHVSVVCSFYFSWKWNFWIHWSLWKHIQVCVSMGALHKVWWPTVCGICTSASITTSDLQNQASERQVLDQTPKLFLVSGVMIAEKRWSKWKGQKSSRSYNFVEVSSIVTK